MRVKWEGMLFGERTLRANAYIQEDRTMKQMTENALTMHIRDERNGLDYTLHGDYYLLDLEVPKLRRLTIGAIWLSTDYKNSTPVESPGCCWAALCTRIVKTLRSRRRRNRTSSRKSFLFPEPYKRSTMA